jgi:hypothetical protein
LPGVVRELAWLSYSAVFRVSQSLGLLALPKK